MSPANGVGARTAYSAGSVPRRGSVPVGRRLMQVQQAVQAQLAPTGYAPGEERVLQEMLKVGLLTEIKPRRTDRQIVYPLVSIQGKPLSETIREERR